MEEFAMSARIAPATAPYPSETQAVFDRIMPSGAPPLSLFTTLARDGRLFQRFHRAALLDKGHLTLRQREIVINRVTALSRSEYEWGVHVAFFAEKAGLDAAMLASLANGCGDDPCWPFEERVLIKICDQLHAASDIDDDLWNDAAGCLSEMALIEILMLAGFYRTVSYLTNALRLPMESFAARFPASAP
jgi:alkylhydroperoxidase family enzyme